MIRALGYVRLAWLRGLYGTGKTLLSVAILWELLRRGWQGRVFCPFPLDAPIPDHTARSAILILDEAGTVFGNRSFADKELSGEVGRAVSFLRKTDSYLLFPSYSRPDIMFRRGLHIQSKARIGRLVWLYRWWLPADEETEDDYSLAPMRGVYPLIFPARFFGTYDTLFVPTSRDVIGAIAKFNKFTIDGGLVASGR